jgi:Raf kinase inhibitor-like YbhB/YbcL family protein
MKRLYLLALALAAPGAGLSGQEGFRLTSPAFADGGFMPAECSSERLGKNCSPPLAWEGPPAGTASFALLVEDLDVPAFVRVTHWIVYNIPADARSLAKGIPQGASLPDGSAQGRNFYGKPGYLGPKPFPSWATHRYRFRLMALDARLPEGGSLGRKGLLRAVEGHVAGESLLVGLFGARR